ncbi:MAG: ABC transporter ATP-binding protein [Anaerolineae bacterium]|jgi:iron complex transport system ATP-binding protein|nr:ABC transporter ATP-binding protein [Anaerolineae bacterium]MBT7070836.1 ABC transporter ATP-binding protein [Anaerolineae bacterium]MBT7323718.1 ABC transporter ATP-binding protein [Anaerolineae bacterium]
MLEVSTLSASYGKRRILHEISFAVEAGEILALIGPNGAGKTTLIRAASGTLPIEAGQVRVRGRNVTKLGIAERARNLAVVPQAQQLGGAYSVEEAVMMGRTAYMGWLGREGARDREIVAWALAQTQLSDYAQQQIGALSGGEQQRVLLARALAQKTPVLLLDEPTNHLDLQYQTRLLALVQKLAREEKLAVVMALHDLNLVSLAADKVALLVDGKLEALGTSQEVLTAEKISAAYRTPVDVVPHPISGVPIIFPGSVD